MTRFPDVTSGVVGTGFTLGGYPGIVQAIRSGNPEQFAGNAEFQKELNAWSGGGYSSLNVGGQPGAPEGPKLNVPIEGVSASDFLSGKGGAVVIGTGIGAGLAAGGAGIGALFGGGTAAEAGAAGAGAGGGASVLTKLLSSGAGKTGTGVGLAYLAAKYGDRWLQRGAEMVAGFIVAGLGIVIVANGAASSSPATQTAGAVRTVTRTGAGGGRRRKATRARGSSSSSPELAAARVRTEQERTRAVRSRRRLDVERRQETRAAREARDRRMMFEGATAARGASQRPPGPARRVAKSRPKGRRAKR